MNKSDVIVSVIVPTCNPGVYIYDCLNSINNQNLKESLELLLVFNGDYGPLFEDILKYLSERFAHRYHVLYSDKGVSAARNVGIDYSEGEYIAFVDDDDVVSADYLKELLLVASPKSIGMSYVYSFKSAISEMGENFFVCEQQKRYKDYESAPFYKCRSFLAFPVAKLIHRDIIGIHRFDKRFTNGEDALFITSLTDNFQMVKFTRCIAIYYVRERQGSASRTPLPKGKILNDAIKLIVQYLKTYFSSPRRYSLILFACRIPGVIKNAMWLSKN